MIDLKVETFLRVCQTMNYTRAAEELGLTQPSVSQHIRNLEEYYKVKLFTYENKKLKLTEQGAYLKEHLETLSHDVNYMRASVQNIKKKKKMKLGATMSIGEFYIPEKLSSFIKENPDMEITVMIADTKELLNRLDTGDVDFILCEGFFDKSRYDYELIKNEEMCVVCSGEYDCENISDLKSLFGHHLFIREKGSGTREIFENYLKTHNFSLDNFYQCSECTSPHVIKKLLADCHGISVLYKTVVEKELENNSLKEIVVSDFGIVHEFNSVWKAGSIFKEEYRDIIHRLLGTAC